MSSSSPTFIAFFAVAFVLGYTAAAIVLLGLAALLIRSRRRVLVTSISTLSWIVVVTGAIGGLAYIAELLFPWLRGNPYERVVLLSRFSGTSAWFSWFQAFGDVIAPQLFWLRLSRTNACLALAISTAIIAPANVERLIVYITSQSDFTPNSWHQ